VASRHSYAVRGGSRSSIACSPARAYSFPVTSRPAAVAGPLLTTAASIFFVIAEDIVGGGTFAAMAWAPARHEFISSSSVNRYR